MLFVSEADAERIVTRSLALGAVRAALIAAVDGSGRSFPALQGAGPDPQHVFSVKAARSDGLASTALKLGTFWPRNSDAGLPRGNSTVVFLDEASGAIDGIVSAGLVNAYRTAAAGALAVELLARPDARTLAIFGAGFQAYHEVMAIAAQRPLDAVHVVNRTADAAEALVRRLAAAGLNAMESDARTACERSVLVVTATGSRQPLFEAGWIAPGTHVTSMGSDRPGKQELPPDLLRRARLFADLPSQAVAIGDLQHVAAEIAAGAVPVTALGDVARAVAAGRRSAAEITVFDSSGIALQDLFVARAILDEARRRGLGTELT